MNSKFVALGLVFSCALVEACEHASARSPSAGSWATPAAPPPPVAMAAPPPAPALAAPLRVTASSALVTPPGWVNYGGIILPAIPGLTAPAPNAGLNGAAPAAPAPANGWVTIAGITVPAIPGLTVPLANSSAPAASSLLPQGRCGAVTIAGHRIPVDCITPAYGEIPSASRLTLSRSALSAGKGFVGAAPLPTTVDHRTDGSEGPIRDQQDVGACTGFSLAAAIDHAYARSSGSVVPVSVMHVWSRYHDPSMNDAVKDNQDHALTAEAAWPYDEKLACSWDCQDSCHDDLKVSCGAPDPVLVSSADAKPAVTVANITRLDTTTDLEALKEALAKGQDVWFGMQIDADAFSNVQGKDAIVPDGSFRSGSGHAMVLAGYNVQANGTYYLIHNSWGQSWGDRGYAWIHESTLKNNITSAYLVDVSTSNTPHPQAPAKPAPPQPQCPTGQKPDSASGACAPACPDGSPRNANACPVANQCPIGYVNLTGKCVIAAPVLTGQDAKTGIFYTCSSGGCTYAIPFGQAGCALPVCAKSCPAPKFQITVSAQGAGCSE
jgi:hypothetical protein